MPQNLLVRSTPLRFKNPPIIEAVIGIYVPELPDSILKAFQDASSQLSELGFVDQAPRMHHNFNIELEAGSSSLERKELGYQYIRPDRSFAAQFLKNGFLFSQIGSYSTWEEFTLLAKTLWDIYQSIVGATEVVSFQVRYINKLFIPTMKDWENYIRIYPYLPPEVPQGISEYFSRIVMPIENPPGQLTHQQAILPPEREGHLTMLFDNDFQFSGLGLPISSLWSRIDEVRGLKDNYFDYFLTPLMKESFNA